MSLMTLLIFIPACFALNMTPGPNNLMAIANAKHYSFRAACYAGLGRLLAFVGMITLTAMGLATVLHTSALLFLVIKVVGGLYLLWLAYQLWHAEVSADESGAISETSLFRLARREFLMAAGNPKAILVFTAFLPQFIDPNASVGAQFFVLGSLFLLLEWLAIACYAYFGVALRDWFARPAMRTLFNRLCAGFLSSAGIGLLLARKDA